MCLLQVGAEVQLDARRPQAPSSSKWVALRDVSDMESVTHHARLLVRQKAHLASELVLWSANK